MGGYSLAALRVRRQARSTGTVRDLDRPDSYTYPMCMQEKVEKRARRMVRKQLLLTREQNAHLKRIAAATSRSEGELVREAVDDWLSRQQEETEDWRAHLLSLAGMWADRDDLDDFYAELREQRRQRRERMNRLMRGK